MTVTDIRISVTTSEIENEAGQWSDERNYDAEHGQWNGQLAEFLKGQGLDPTSAFLPGPLWFSLVSLVSS